MVWRLAHLQTIYKPECLWLYDNQNLTFHGKYTSQRVDPQNLDREDKFKNLQGFNITYFAITQHQYYECVYLCGCREGVYA